jgi:DNA-binding phage protein
MHKAQLIAFIDAIRVEKHLSKRAIAQAVGLDVKSVTAVLSDAGNPQLSTLLAVLDQVGLEIQLVPKGFGMPTGAGKATPWVPSVVDVALGLTHG